MTEDAVRPDRISVLDETFRVDLMKLLNLDGSLTNRKELAKELNYTGDTNDSVAMNVWLHKQVMQA